MHGIANLSMEERRHIAVLFVETMPVGVGREERVCLVSERLRVLESELKLLIKLGYEGELCFICIAAASRQRHNNGTRC